MTDDRQNPEINPWHPMSDPVDLKHLGKLGEELGEAQSAVCRCLIQGIDEREPVTGKLNREWLEDELSDVMAGLILNVQHFSLNFHRMVERSERKRDQLKTWHRMA